MASICSPNHGDSQAYCIRRNEKQSNLLLNSFRDIFEEECLFDCSIICEDGKVIKGHKFLLAAASQYFKAAFTSFNTSCHNTALLIKEVPYLDLKVIIDFLYRGEVTIEEKQLTSLQKSVEWLKVSPLISQNFSTAPQNDAKQASSLTATPASKLKSQSTLASTSSSNLATNLTLSNPGLTNGTGNFLAAISRPPPILYPNLFRTNVTPQLLKVIAPNVATVKSATLAATTTATTTKIIYPPNEPFVQLRELLRRNPLIKENGDSTRAARTGSHHGKCSSEDHEDKEGCYLSSEEYEIDIPRSRQKFSESCEIRPDSEIEENGASNGSDRMIDCDVNNDDDELDEEEEDDDDDQVIDMSVNSDRTAGRVSNHHHHHTNNNIIINSYKANNGLDHHDDSPSGDSIDLDDKGCPSSSNTSNSYSVLPISSSTFNSATARAIAASTTLALASGLLSKSNSPANCANGSVPSDINHHGNHDNDLQGLVPLKRGRGRPPRHLRDGAGPLGNNSCSAGLAEDLKTYKVRPIPPSSSNDHHSHHLTSQGIIISSEPAPLPLKKKRVSPEGSASHHTPGAGNKGRKPKLGPPAAADTNGKNVCPYCPQVYYSNQAMNDHINNVHTGNAHKYTCEMCGKEFSWKISLTKHLRNTHRQEKLTAEVDKQSVVM